MDRDTWLTPQEAIEFGLIDNIITTRNEAKWMELDADSLVTKEERASLLGNSYDDDEDTDEDDEDVDGVLKYVRILIPEISVDDFNELTRVLDELGIDYEEL
jgi:hypothetical protein